MADIADGTYVILTALNTNCALECRRASDDNYANVRIFTKNNSDAQFITVVTNSDGSRRMLFTMSGKSIDVNKGTFTNGTNVQQFSNNDSRAQKWDIVPDGNTITVGSTTYSTYVIKCSENKSYAMDVSGGKGVSGTNVQIYSVNGSNAQRWVFIPKDPVPLGTYLIRSALDTNAVLDVCGASSANGANIQLYGENDGNNQIWRVQEYSSGLMTLYCVGSGKVMSVGANSPKNGQNVQQWVGYQGHPFKWYAEPSGSMSINGATVPTYRLHYLTSQGFVLDAAGGKSTPKTNIQVYANNGSRAQLWAFQPFSILANNLPVPEKFGISVKQGTSIADHEITANGVTSIYLSWQCSGTTYQIRYRERQRKPNQAIGDWSSWMSYPDASTANSGWGDIGSANCVTENTSRKFAPKAITMLQPVDGTNVDYKELQFEIRRYEANYNGTSGLHAHGNSIIETFRLTYTPTLTINSCKWSPDGLDISYTSDYHRDGNIITFSSDDLFKECRFTDQPYTGNVRIPQSALSRMPTNGEKITMRSAIMSDIESSTSGRSVTISYASSPSLTVSPKTIDDTDSYTTTVTFTPSTENHVYLSYPGNLIECEGSNGKYIVTPPLNAECTIYVFTSNGSAWGMASVKKTMKGKVYVWNWKGKTAVIKLNVDKSPEYSDNRDSDNSSQVTTGRPRPVYTFGNTITRSLDVSGVYTDIVPNGKRENMDELTTAEHATFRNPQGEVLHTAILSVNLTPKGNRSRIGEWGEVSVKQMEESL